MRVAVVGARGQLGAALVHACQGRHEAIPLDRAALDITDPAAIQRAMAAIRPEVVVNCAAYNAVDEAEQQAAEAIRVNAVAVRSLVRALGGAAFVHFSTDFVFDGTATSPYVETDKPNPLSVYAMSKLLGEWMAADAPRGYVLRVESLFGAAPGSRPKGSLAAIAQALADGATPRVFEDRTVSPTSVADAARAALTLVEASAPSGLYHCVNNGAATWLEVGREVARLLGCAPRFDVVPFGSVKMAAARPKYCALSNAKLAAAGVQMPTWQDALADALRGTRASREAAGTAS